MSLVPRPDRTPEILSALESNPTATNQQIADELGVSPQRVSQVRKAQHGARPAGRPARGDGPAENKVTVRLADYELAAIRGVLVGGESVAEFLRDAAIKEVRARNGGGLMPERK